MARPKQGYKLNNGKSALGTTTVINRFDDKQGIIFWAFKQGKAAERGEIRSLYDKRDEAAEAGTLAHDMVEAHILGKDPDKMLIRHNYSDLVIEQAMNAYFAYRQWERQSRLEILQTEIPLVSNEYGFGGCIDAVGKFDGKLILLDWKTGAGVYVGQLIQLAAYRQLWDENFPDNPITGGYHLCRFDKVHADFSHKFYSNLDEAWEAMKHFITAYPIVKALEKRVK